MNRIRKYNNVYQVLITPDIKISPDSAILIGNWDDENLRNFRVMEFTTLNDALAESYKYPDLDWYRLTLNHEQIFLRLKDLISGILKEGNFMVDFKATLMDADTMKNSMFNKVMIGGDNFNLKNDFNNIICFTIVNPWTNIVHKISKTLEIYRSYLYRDDLRIMNKKIIDGKIIHLYGYTELGTLYLIKIIPTLLYQWSQWTLKNGYENPENKKIFMQLLKTQDIIDKGPVLK